MTIDLEKYRSPASKGDVARVALYAMIGLTHARWGLMKQIEGTSADEDIEALQANIEKLSASFNELTGWTAES